jgi:hypothetical protein
LNGSFKSNCDAGGQNEAGITDGFADRRIQRGFARLSAFSDRDS